MKKLNFNHLLLLLALALAIACVMVISRGKKADSQNIQSQQAAQELYEVEDSIDDYATKQ